MPATLHIAIEGVDGAGKTTVRNALSRAMIRAGHPCSITGPHAWLDVDAGRRIVAFRERRGPVEPAAVSDAWFRDKQVIATRVIAPALDRVSVLSDRYVFSDAVYHEVLLDIPAMTTLERHLHAGTRMPDLLLYVDVDAELALARIEARTEARHFYEDRAHISPLLDCFRRVVAEVDRRRLAPVLTFLNHRADVAAAVEEEIMPVVVAALGNAAETSPSKPSDRMAARK
ncbi:deoxynucleoside kinase [Tistrella mobilis]|uniref:dTMP kinase n=1 Tax=Tistrella mobilis TaxID=171437 RepID=UPI0035592EB7